MEPDFSFLSIFKISVTSSVNGPNQLLFCLPFSLSFSDRCCCFCGCSLLRAFEEIIFFYFTMAKQTKQILEELGEKLKTFGSNGQVKEDCVSSGGKRFSVSL